MIINCTIASNVPEWLDDMKKSIEDLFGVKFEEKNECCCSKKCQCKKIDKEFDDVQEIEHIN